MKDLPIDIMTNEASFRFWVVQSLSIISTEMEGLGKFRDDIETRLRKVESRIWTAAGAASVIGSIGAAVLTYVMRALWK